MRDSIHQWLDRTIDRGKPPVFLENELPAVDIRRELQRSGALVRLPGGVYFLCRPGDDENEVIHALYWPIIERLLERYAPAVIERDSAVRLYLGDASIPETIRIRQGKNARTMSEQLAPGLRVKV